MIFFIVRVVGLKLHHLVFCSYFVLLGLIKVACRVLSS
jgi:hypothetical protein